jgi:hypothetical protein
MLFRGVRVFGADKVSFTIEDGILMLWVDDTAGLAPSEANTDETNGDPWSIRGVVIHGTNDQTGDS